MEVLKQSVVKANNDVYDNKKHRKNEDAIHKTKSFIALADGAGGIGILADLWAKTLVRKVPKKAFESISSLEKWITSFWEEFYKKSIPFLQSDPWKLEKFEDEGSFATLSVLWEVAPSEFVYQSYGDTAMFVYNNKSGDLQIQENLRSINSFTVTPPLINWQTEKLAESCFFSQKIKLKENEEIILATDGIALYIWAAYLVFTNNLDAEINEPKTLKVINYFKQNSIASFTDFIDEFKKMLASRKLFSKFTKELYHSKNLPNDDYTMAFVK